MDMTLHLHAIGYSAIVIENGIHADPLLGASPLTFQSILMLILSYALMGGIPEEGRDRRWNCW
jgi:hypothetical protein